MICLILIFKVLKHQLPNRKLQMKKIIITSLIVFVFTSFTIFNNFFTDLVKEKLSNYITNGYPEKIYIHIDKPYYTLDDNIWFSCYLVNGTNHTKSDKSTVIHVELINENDSIVAKRKLFTEDINTAGDIKIPLHWKAGKYLLRAYTNDMRNSDSDYFFQKEIPIWSLSKKERTENIHEAQVLTGHEMSNELQPDINFYPEGGYLIENIRNNIAVKIKNLNLEETSLNVSIKDNEDTEIFKFKTLKFGFGQFSLSPEPNKSYYASVILNGIEKRYPLPKALAKGFVVNAKNEGDQILIKAMSNTNSGLKGTFLVAHQRGRLIFSKYEKALKSDYLIELSTAQFDDGVTHLTLFDAEGNPVWERLIYIDNPQNDLTINIKKEKDILSPKEKNSLKIDVIDKAGNSIPSHLSMSIRDLDLFPQNGHSKNIKTWLLLNSDLRGKIKNPGYFFDGKEQNKKRYLLDLVMLTHGWRRFTWPELLNKTQKNKFPIEKGIHISGKILNLKAPYRATKASTRLNFLGHNIHQEKQITTPNGIFNYGPYIIFDTIPTIIEARLTNFKSINETDRNLFIALDKPDSIPKVSRKTILKSDISDDTQLANYIKITEYLEQLRLQYGEDTHQLDEITITAQKEKEVDARIEAMNSRTDYGEAARRIVMDDIAGSGTYSVFQLLRNITGVTVNGSEVSIRGGQSPAFYLDGFEVEIEFIEDLSGSDIDFIDVLQGAEAATFANSGNGIIALYSKEGISIGSGSVKRKPGIIDFKSVGFYTARTFYSPDYASDFENFPKADVRPTLYWNPQIKVTENMKPELSFFTSDSKGEYFIEIEGISGTGIPVYNTSTFTVE